MSYRVFVFDIDNTLTSRLDGHFVESTVESLRELRKKGHKVVIASGRMPKTATQLADNGIEYDYFIGATGQIVTDNQFNVLWSQCFSDDLFERISEYCRQNGYGYFWKMDDCSYIVVNNSTIDNIFNTYR
ncbi:MAG: HAD family phosphatase, partial [Erysipelotrichaceae bacterium]|nr:HAD family phosphatase [Erysipelotrichaceae bacterium]